MSHIYISLGSNVGDSVKNLAQSEELLIKHGFVVVKKSKLYDTEEWNSAIVNLSAAKNPHDKNHTYTNQCMELSFDLSPAIAFEKLRNIELEMGRDRMREAHYKKTNKVEFAPRVIDLDILFYEDWFVRDAKALKNEEGVYEELIIPHTQLHFRKFVLVPLAEIAPDFVHPVLQKNISQLLKECLDRSIVKAR